jgi:hypothetical protein
MVAGAVPYWPGNLHGGEFGIPNPKKEYLSDVNRFSIPSPASKNLTLLIKLNFFTFSLLQSLPFNISISIPPKILNLQSPQPKLKFRTFQFLTSLRAPAISWTCLLLGRSVRYISIRVGRGLH